MSQHRWSIYSGSKYIDSGPVEAESERDALVQVLDQQGANKNPDESYTITVGDTTMSSYGDEFARSGEVTGWGADKRQKKLKGGHLFPAPVMISDEMVWPEMTADVTIDPTKGAAEAMGVLGGAFDGLVPCSVGGNHSWVVYSPNGEEKCTYCGVENYSTGTTQMDTGRSPRSVNNVAHWTVGLSGENVTTIMEAVQNMGLKHTDVVRIAHTPALGVIHVMANNWDIHVAAVV